MRRLEGKYFSDLSVDKTESQEVAGRGPGQARQKGLQGRGRWPEWWWGDHLYSSGEDNCFRRGKTDCIVCISYRTACAVINDLRNIRDV